MKRRLQLGVILATAIAAAIFYRASSSQAQQATPGDLSTQRTLLEDYCVSCHNQKSKTAGIVLEGLNFQNVGEHADIWEKVLRKVRTGQMPPPKAPHPEAAESAAFTKWLESALDRAAETNPNPGRPTAHRLNREEYSNAIRDLLAVDIRPGMSLPIDDSGYGFDNIGEVLSLSPSLLEKYLKAANRVSRLAVGDPGIKPTEDRYQMKRLGNRNERNSDDLPFYSRGGFSIQHYFPLDAEYLIRVKTQNYDDGPRYFELRLPVKAGLRTVGVAYPRADAKPEPGIPAGRQIGAPATTMSAPSESPMDLRLDGARIKRFDVPDNQSIELITVNGPFIGAGGGDTLSREKIFICRPASKNEEAPCARKIFTALARRAFRRTVTEADLAPLLAFYQKGRRPGNFDAGIQNGIEALLVSPDFLFRVEQDPRPSARDAKTGSVYRINDFDLASRLSFFLWSSIPDETLLGLAEKAMLRDPAVLDQQVTRMLEDRRSEAFVKNFGGQWLQLRNLETITPDPDIFPGFDETLRQSLRRETELFFDSILRENRSVLELLSANYTFLNQRLAEHYGVRGVYGSQFRRFLLADKNRGGLLGQGSILTVTSYPNRTSVVQRGKWVLENLLGSPPPPPPPDIPDLKPHGKDGKQLSMREQMELHRANPTCASCHARMDPIGFALENYDGVGKWRVNDAGATIDSSGKLPDGTTFNGPAELTKILLAGHRDEYVATVTEKILTYALGRGLEAYDAPTIRAIAGESARDGYRLQAMIHAVVKSSPFQMRRRPTL
jgi:mono/diheme cytochrome c family protein